MERDLDLYRTVVQNIEEVVYRVVFGEDRFHGRVEYVSDQVRRAIGYEPEDFLTDPGLWESLIHPEDLQQVQEQSQEMTVSGRTVTRIYRLKHRDKGEYVWMEDRVTPQLDVSGRLLSIQGVARDITDRWRMEQALRRSEERFRQLAENMMDVVYMLSFPDYSLIYVNEAYERIWQRKREDLYRDQYAFLQTVHPEDVSRVREAVEDSRSGKYTSFEYRIIRPNGEIRWIHDHTFAVPDDSGKLIVMGGIGRDITDSRLAEEILRRNAEEMQAVYEGMLDGILVCDVESRRVLRANRIACNMLGYNEEEILALKVEDCHPPEMAEEGVALFAAAAAGESTRVNERIPFLRKDGRLILLDVISTPIHCGGRLNLMGILRPA